MLTGDASSFGHMVLPHLRFVFVIILSQVFPTLGTMNFEYLSVLISFILIRILFSKKRI